MDTRTYKASAHWTPSNESLKQKYEKFQITKELLDSFLYGRRTVQPVDVGKHSTDRKRKSENLENEQRRKIQSLWCKECCKHIQGECPIHSSYSPSNGLKLTYAVRSFPPEVQLCTSSIPGCQYGVYAGKLIPRGTWIGPYEGKPVYSTKLPDNTDNTYVWEIYKNGHFSHFVDGSDEGCSSWMRFIRCARNKTEQNMRAFQYGQNIYYRALCDISAGEELLVWYDHTYFQFCGIPLALKEEIKVSEKETTQDRPVLAHHTRLPGPSRPQLSHSPKSQNVSSSQRSTSLTSPTTASPYSQVSIPFQLQQSPQVSRPYHMPQPFPVPQQFQLPLSSPVSAPNQIPASPQLPQVSNVPRTSRVPSVTQGRSTLHAPSSQLPQVSFGPSLPRISSGSQMPPSPQLPPPHIPPGISTPGTFYRPAAGQKERGLMNVTASVTPPLTRRSPAVEVKENMPVGNSTIKADLEIQQKTAINAQALKPSSLQNISPCLQKTALSEPQEKGLDYVSSTVDTNEDSSWKCGQCGKIFSQRLTLQVHVCSKSPERPFQCGHCSLAFSYPSDLRDHVITHTNDRPFKCGFCGRSFAGATTLNNHMRTHTGEKPFACEICGRTFAIATQLKRHMKVPGECGMPNKDAQLYNQNAAITVER